MDSFRADVVSGFRSLTKRPAFALTAIATLALGIGATAAIFSVVNAVLLRRLPYSDPARLVHVWNDLRNRNVSDFPWPPADFHDLRGSVTMFDGLAALSTGRLVIAARDGEGEAMQLRFGQATPNLFRLLGARVALGSGHRCRRGPIHAAAPGRTGRRAFGAAATSARDPESRVLAAPVWRQAGYRRHRRDGGGQHPLRRRRRSRAGLRAAVSARHQRRAPA